MSRAHPRAADKVPANQHSTCADEHDGVSASVQSQHPVHHDAGQQGAPPHQQRPSAQRPGGLVHQRTVPDELEGLVRKVQRSVHAHFPRHVINALKQGTALSNSGIFLFLLIVWSEIIQSTKGKLRPACVADSPRLVLGLASPQCTSPTLCETFLQQQAS